MRLYVYKCVVDDGAAPCVDSGLLSLSICKPRIRRSAAEGDFIFAFGSNRETPANRLVYIAKVTEKVVGGEYYRKPVYRSRMDCIYRLLRNGKFAIRRDAKVHGTQAAMLHDLGGSPSYPRAVSLLSTEFRYFGGSGTAAWKERAPSLADLVENLKQGERVNHPRVIRDELLALQKWVWSSTRRKAPGRPLHSVDDRHSCRKVTLAQVKIVEAAPERLVIC